MAFALGAGIGSGLGYKMGSTQVAVYTNDVSVRRSPGSVDPAAAESTELSRQSDAQSGLPLSLLEERLVEFEQRLLDLESVRGGHESDVASPEPSTIGTRQAANELQSQLLNNGFSQGEYDVIANTRDELQLKRLQLRDKAIREGWFRSERWVDQSRVLNADSALRTKLGDERFEDYLTASGRNNRVKIDDVMAGSAAQQAGILPGDVIYRYADQRVYLSAELRNMTTAGEAGETTALTVLRNGEQLDLSVPRGPLGVMISGIAISPGNQ